jgi:hypothetical protein
MAATDDPTYLAYLRALGFEDAAAKDEAALGELKAKAQIGLYEPEIDYQGDIARRDIGLAHEDRGMFRSGQHLTAVAEQEHEQALQHGELALKGADSVAGIQRTLAQQTSANARKLADQGLLADTRQYLDRGLSPYRT